MAAEASGGLGGAAPPPWEPDETFYYNTGSKDQTGSTDTGGVIGIMGEKSFGADIDQFAGSIGTIVEDGKEWNPDKLFQFING